LDYKQLNIQSTGSSKYSHAKQTLNTSTKIFVCVAALPTEIKRKHTTEIAEYSKNNTGTKQKTSALYLLES